MSLDFDRFEAARRKSTALRLQSVQGLAEAPPHGAGRGKRGEAQRSHGRRAINGQLRDASQKCARAAVDPARGAANRYGRSVTERVACGTCRHASAAFKRTGVNPDCAMRVRSWGNTSRMTGVPERVRAACPSCSSRMSPRQGACETHEYGFRIAVHGVKSAPRPACEHEIEARQNGIEQGTAQASRSAKKQRPSTGDSADSLLRPFNLTGERTRPEQRKIVEMPVAMIFNGMAAPHDLAREFGAVLDAPADAEKRDFDSVFVEKVEHLRSDRGSGTIIDAERNFAAACRCRWQARQVRTEQSAARPKARRGELHMIEDDRAERHGQRLGRASASAAAPTCKPAEALRSGVGLQRDEARVAIY